MQVKKLYIVLFLFCFANIFSQLEKGDEFYKNAQYKNAIPRYKKVAKSASSSKKDKQEALIKLGNSYKKLNDYDNAAKSYSEALTIKTKNAATSEFLFNYGQVLRSQGKYTEAAEQFSQYVALNPTNINAKNILKFCQDIKTNLAKAVEYTVTAVSGINTAESEFGPFVSNSKLYYAAARPEFNFSEFIVNDYDGSPYFHLYTADINGTEMKKEKEIPREINTEYFDGPACLSPDGKTLYFSRVNVVPTAGVTNHSKIYSATLKGDKWTDIKILNVSSDEYSVAHPSISADDNTLYFTSNMPGGLGGKDIYMSRRSGITWTKPVNLGPDVNTNGDEMFPSLRKDGILFFSSNGLPGYGGLDIYTAQKFETRWLVTRNEGQGINSKADDFAIAFTTDSTGYFSSNREGGKGKDDIYAYKYTSKAMSISGTLLLTQNINNPAKKIRILLKDETGTIVDSLFTDEKGFFIFKNLNSDMKYMAVLSEDDPTLSGKARFYLATTDGVIVRVSGPNGKDRFAFRNLPLDHNALPDMYADEDLTLTLAGNLLYDDKGTSKPIKNTTMMIVNDFGDVMEKAVTNEFGAFVFRNIPADQNYIISVDETDVKLNPGTRVFITNKSGKEIKSFYVGKDKINFKILKADKVLMQEMQVEDPELHMNIDGYMYDQDKKPIANTRIRIREEGTNKVYDWTTTIDGKFKFRNLDADKNYIFESDETDPTLGGLRKVYIGDKNGKIFRMLDIIGGKFNFKMIEGDKYAMGEFEVDDPWLEALQMKNSAKQGGAPLTIVESILYASGDFKPDAAGITILDKVSTVLASNPKLMIEIISHTDSRSSDAFNLTLSKKRAQTAVDYIAAKGIDIKRLKAIGLGETKLLNRCANGVECSDDEHKVNRRTEFKITESPKM